MNSPNFGKQQIILQSCCFFDYEKSQTPQALHQNKNIFDKKNKKRLDSEHIPFSKNYKNIYLQTKMNLDKIKSKIEGIQNNNEEYASSIDKLKKENKALKDTINNLVLQLDKVFLMAETSKNNEMNIIEMNKNNKQEIKEMKNKINTLTIENEELLRKIKENQINTVARNNNIKKIINLDSEGNNNKIKNKIIINNKNQLKKHISDTNFLRKMNRKRSITERNDINIDLINKLNKENIELKNKINEENNISMSIFNEKEAQIKNLLQENYDLNLKVKELQSVNKKFDNSDKKMDDLIRENDENTKKLKLLENVNIENIYLSNKLIEADNKIADYIKKYENMNLKYNELKEMYRGSEKSDETCNEVYINKNKYEKIKDNCKQEINYINDKNNIYNNYNNLQIKYEDLLKEKNELKSNFNDLLSEYNKNKDQFNEGIDKIIKLKEDNTEYKKDNSV